MPGLLHVAKLPLQWFTVLWILTNLFSHISTTAVIEYFHQPPQIPPRPFTVSPFPFPSSLATMNLISVPTLLPFPECPMYGVKQYTAFESGSFYLISLRALSSTLLHWFCFVTKVQLAHPNGGWWPQARLFVTVHKVCDSFSGGLLSNLIPSFL